MRAVIQAAIGKALLCLEEANGAIGNDDSSAHDPVVCLWRRSAPPKIHGTP